MIETRDGDGWLWYVVGKAYSTDEESRLDWERAERELTVENTSGGVGVVRMKVPEGPSRLALPTGVPDGSGYVIVAVTKDQATAEQVERMLAGEEFAVARPLARAMILRRQMLIASQPPGRAGRIVVRMAESAGVRIDANGRTVRVNRPQG